MDYVVLYYIVLCCIMWLYIILCCIDDNFRDIFNLNIDVSGI